MELSHIIIIRLKKNKTTNCRSEMSRNGNCFGKHTSRNREKDKLTPFKNTSLRTPENRLLGIRFVKLNGQ